ncbi:hypothetical protein HQ47_06115 [Porphyromonas macacae]|uniref:Uncharacterized protein n=1 Tax=Porphyromonas macacae TaxID=28115 RepID=A0A0A2E8R7_9PORP|nr:hypothetical protein [Porphyromonas macacae]KGN74037.1 hypothetical protein HQ47_06115 [Porphyromonas macacae]SUB88637.1 Uncharacterised protein [Porphyromonas macacae]
MNLTEDQGIKKEKLSFRTVLIAIAVGFFTYMVFTDGPDIVRGVKSGEVPVPGFLKDVRDGFMDGFYARPPRY